MTRVLWTLLLASVAIVAAGCGGPHTGNCNASNCTGCCTSTGECKDGKTAAACGFNGAECQSCGTGTCGPALTCLGGTGGGTGGTGGGGPVQGDACAAAITIPLANGVGAATATLAGSTDDATGSCGGAGHGDVVFQLTTPSAGTLTIDARPGDAAQRLVAYLRTTCETAATELPGACVSARSGGAATLLTQRNLAAGTYFLWVDGAASGSGSVDVSLSFAPSAGETCTDAIPLAFKNNEANAVGSTAGATNDVTSVCGGAGPDLVYRFDVTSPSNFDVTVTPHSTSLQPVVSVRGASCGANPLGCNAASAGGASAVLRLGSLPAGTYYLAVDSASSNAGEFELVAHLSTAVAGDTCASAKTLTFTNGSSGGVASDTGDTSLAWSDTQGLCGGLGGSDVVYRFTTGATLNLRAGVSSTNPNVQPVVYLRAVSCTGSERACGLSTDGGVASLAYGGLTPGTYYLWVDDNTATGGPYTLSASLEAPLQGESCANPRSLVFSNGTLGGTASDTGDTSQAFPEAQGSCGGSAGADLVYTFTTTTQLSFTASATTLSSGYQPVLYLRSSFCTTSGDRACNQATVAGGTASLASANLPAGTYYLWVDGASATGGGYTLDAALAPPPPGDVCTNPKNLSFSNGAAGGTATATGDTTGLSADTYGTCWASTAEPDEVYAFSTTTALDLRATVTPTGGSFRPVVYVRSTTCTGAQLACTAATTSGNGAALAVGALPAGNYSLFVDGAGGTSGPYSLTASLTPPAVGEGCANPKPLVFSLGSDGGVASDTGDTSLDFQDGSGSCTSTSAPDLVYSFTSTKTLDFAASLSTTAGTYWPAMVLRTATCTGAERTCAAATSVGGTANLAVQGLPAGTWYLWVDGATASGGQYNLTASLLPAPPDAVRALPITNVASPGPMTVTFQVVDRYGNVMSGDNTTSFTISLNGSAIFTGASQGTINSGSGTNTVVVTVVNGQVTLTLTDAVAQTVTFTTTDSQGNGLKYPGNNVFTQTSPPQPTPCDTNNNRVFTFATSAQPTGPATVTVNSRGDLNGGTTEYLNVYMESTAGTPYGSIFTGGPGQCATAYGVATVNVPLTSLQTYLADGTLNVVLVATSAVNCVTCPTINNDTFVTLSYPTTLTATFL